MLIKKEHQWFIQNVKAIPGEFQHSFVIADVDKKKIRVVVRKVYTERRKMSLLRDLKIRKRFDGKAIKVVNVGVPNLWGNFKDGILMVCDEACVWGEEGEVREIHGGGMKR